MYNEISNMTSIILPFYIKKINNLLLYDKEQSTYPDWQDELGLPDDEIEKLDSSRIVFVCDAKVSAVRFKKRF